MGKATTETTTGERQRQRQREKQRPENNKGNRSFPAGRSGVSLHRRSCRLISKIIFLAGSLLLGCLAGSRCLAGSLRPRTHEHSPGWVSET